MTGRGAAGTLAIMLGLVVACGGPRTAPTAPTRTRTPPGDTGGSGDTSAWTRLGPPSGGSWRERFPDDVPMSFEDYVASDPVRADGARRVLAFLPVGEFAPTEREMLDTAAEFCGIWFGLPVRVRPPADLTKNTEWTRERPIGPGGAVVKQAHTQWFLDRLLPPRVPDDAVVLLGVTMTDLYPQRDWNFVFGQANLRRRVGVYSLARYFPQFEGEPDTRAGRRLALLRTLKVVTHEAGHTFGLEHCVTWACNMNGSNSLPETDAQPLVLCPECRRKLAWNRGFDLAARDRDVARHLEAHGFADEAAWHAARSTGR